MKNLNKELQIKIGSLLNKDYFKLPPQEIENPNHNFYKVGFEPTLNDILISINGKIELNPQSNNTLYIRELFTENEIYYDLTKSLFQQDEKTKVALLNLITK